MISHDDAQIDRNYRRGAIMGLTMAEAFVLIAFALLLLFAFWQWEVQKEDTPEVLAFKQLPVAKQTLFLDGVREDAFDTYIMLREQGVDLSELAEVVKNKEKWRFVDDATQQRILDVAKTLPRDAQKDLAKLMESVEAVPAIEQLSALSSEQERDKWRFIDKDDERRLLDAAAALPEDVQRDLADLIEAKDAIPILKQLSALEELIRNGQVADIEGLLAANARLGQVSRKIQAAAEQEGELVATLKRELDEIVASFDGYIDDTGAIILPDNVLFEQGKARITPRLARFLFRACAPWLDALKESGVDIAEVKIEGHASSEWRSDSSPRQAYLGNLDLSQRRSQVVLRNCLDLVPDQEVLDWARKHLIAVGYSSVRPVVRDGTEDKVASRRVVFSVTPDRNALIEQIQSDVASEEPQVSTAPDEPAAWAPEYPATDSR